MEGNQQLQELLQRMTDQWHACQSGQLQTMVIQTPDQPIYDEEIKNHLLQLDQNLHDYTYWGAPLAPFFPFLNIVGEQINRQPASVLEKWINQSVFYAFRELFEDYLINQHVKSIDMMRLREAYKVEQQLKYEQFEMLESVINLFLKSFETISGIVYVQSLEFASPTVFELLEKLLRKKRHPAKLLIIIQLRNEVNQYNLPFPDSYYRFVMEQMVDIPIFQVLTDASIEPIPSISHCASEQAPEELLKRADWYCMFYQLREAEHLLVQLSKDTQQMLILQNDSYLWADFCQLFGDVYMYLHDYDHALVYYQKLLDRIPRLFYHSKRTRFYQKMAYTLKLKYDVSAEKNNFLELCLQYANELKDETELLFAHFFYTAYYDHKDTSALMESLSRLEAYSHRTKRFELLNLRLMNILHTPEASELYFPSFDHKKRHLTEQLEVMKKNKNRLMISSYYNMLSIIYVNHREQSNYYLTKSLNVQKNILDKLAYAISLNVYGYNSMSFGYYQEALSAHLDALHILMNEKKFMEVILTLFNIGFTLFMAKNDMLAIPYLRCAYQIAQITNIQNIPFHTISGIYTVLGICYLKVGDKFKASYYYNQMKFQPPTNYPDEKMLAEILKGYLSNHLAEMREAFDEANQSPAHQYWTCWRLVVADHYSQALLKWGQIHEAERVFRLGLLVANRVGIPLYQEVFHAAIQQQQITIPKLRIKIKIHLELFVNEAKQQMASNQLIKKSSEFNILHRLQSIFQNKHQSSQFIYGELSTILKTIYQFTSISSVLTNGMDFTCDYSDYYHESLIKGIIADTVAVIQEKKMVYTTDQIEPSKQHLVLPLISHQECIGFILLGLMERPFGSEDMELMQLVAKELSNLLLNRLMEKVLQDQSIEVQRSFFNLTNLMNNVDQGFLSFGKDLLIKAEYSRKCDDLFQRAIAGKSFPEMMFPHTEAQQTFQTFCGAFFEEKDDSMKKVYLQLIQDGFGDVYANERYISIKYKAIHDQLLLSEAQILVILTDVTDQRLLQLKLDQESNSLRMMVKVAQNKTELKQVLESFDRYVNVELFEMLAVESDYVKLHEQVYRTIHTYKGTFSQYYIQQLVDVLHEMEDHFYACDPLQLDLHSFWALIPLQKINRNLIQFKNRIEKSFGKSFFEIEDRIVIDPQELHLLKKEVFANLPSSALPRMKTAFERLEYVPLRNLLERFVPYVEELSTNLDKKTAPLEIVGGTMKVNPRKYANFIQSLVHVFRNMLDHGIETSEERQELNKSEVGTISCVIEQRGNQIHITISDDGRGIDRERVYVKALEKGLLSSEQRGSVSDEALIELIFHDDFSTKEEVTSYSGRGIGMSAVREETEKLGGQLKIQSEVGQGTSFQFQIPAE